MITLPEGTAERLNEGMDSGNSIELPFFTPVFWAMNGNARLKGAGGAQYYGGLAVSAEHWQQALEEWGLTEADTPEIVRTELTTADGKPLDAYTTRKLIVAPIATRTTWYLQDGRRSTEYVPGARQHAQVIAILGVKGDNGPKALGPIMLSAKGFQAKNLLNTFSLWSRATAKARGKVAPGVPAWFFYLAIGTFGEERKQEMVGKNSQSPITPITLYTPKDISEDLIESLFVGQDTAEQMIIYLEGASEWLHAYDALPQNGNGNGNGHKTSPGYSSDPFDGAPEPDYDDPFGDEEIPF